MTRGLRPHPCASRARRVPLLVLAIGLGGCAWDTSQSTLVARSDFAREILGVYRIIAWAAIAIAAIVFLALALVLLRYRERPDTAGLPRQTRGHTALEIAWTIGPALVLLVIAIPTIRTIFRTQAAATPGALEVTVRAWQWWWEFEYPSLGIVTANELHLPAGQPVTLRLEGRDVIHSFWIPQLGGKRDVIPGRVNRLSFTPEVPGEYPGQCAEFCGVSHANMRKRVIVESPEAFEQWVDAQRPRAVEPADLAAEGKEAFARHACVGCHTIRGVSGGKLAPDLTHFGSRRTFAAGMYPVTAENVAAWVEHPPALKPGVKMPALPLTKHEIQALAAYLVNLK